MEDSRLGRVDVFRLVLFGSENAAAERDDAPLFVADWEHQPSAEPVVEPWLIRTALAAQHQSRRFEQSGGKLPGFRPLQKRVPTVGRVTEPPFPHRFGRDGAFFQVGARRLGGFVLEQVFVEERRGLFVEFDQQFLFVPARPASGFLELDSDAGPLRQPPHRLGEFEVLILHHELEYVASFAAAEAVPDLLLRADVETRGLLLVKRAESAQVRPGAF